MRAMWPRHADCRLRPLCAVHRQGSIDRAHGDVLDVLNSVDLRPCKVILTEPPYLRWGPGQELATGLCAWTPDADATWVTDTLEWTQAWLPAIWQMTEYSLGRAWIFGHVLYLPALVRTAHLLRWRVRSYWFNALSDQCLTVFGLGVPPAQHASVQQGFAETNGAAHLSIPLLTQVLAISDEGTILDPFCGDGGTLVAAKRAGRQAVGIDLDVNRCAAAVAAVEAV